MEKRHGSATVDFLSFSDLKEKLVPGMNPFYPIVKNEGVVYVTELSRDECDGCRRRKPYFERFAEEVAESHPNKASFLIVNASYRRDYTEEALEAKRIFDMAAFPTVVMHVLNDRKDVVQTYKAISPPLGEIRRNFVVSVEMAEKFWPKVCDRKSKICK